MYRGARLDASSSARSRDSSRLARTLGTGGIRRPAAGPGGGPGPELSPGQGGGLDPLEADTGAALGLALGPTVKGVLGSN